MLIKSLNHWEASSFMLKVFSFCGAELYVMLERGEGSAGEPHILAELLYMGSARFSTTRTRPVACQFSSQMVLFPLRCSWWPCGRSFARVTWAWTASWASSMTPSWGPGTPSSSGQHRCSDRFLLPQGQEGTGLGTLWILTKLWRARGRSPWVTFWAWLVRGGICSPLTVPCPALAGRVWALVFHQQQGCCVIDIKAALSLSSVS